MECNEITFIEIRVLDGGGGSNEVRRVSGSWKWTGFSWIYVLK